MRSSYRSAGSISAGNSGPTDCGNWQYIGDSSVDIAIRHLALYHLQAGIFNGASAVTSDVPTPAGNTGDATADRPVCSNEALERQPKIAPATRNAIRCPGARATDG